MQVVLADGLLHQRAQAADALQPGDGGKELRVGLLGHARGLEGVGLVRRQRHAVPRQIGKAEVHVAQRAGRVRVKAEAVRGRRRDDHAAIFA